MKELRHAEQGASGFLLVSNYKRILVFLEGGFKVEPAFYERGTSVSSGL